MTPTLRVAIVPLVVILAILAGSVVPTAAWAQANSPTKTGPTKGDFPRLNGKVVSLEEAVAVALDAQPQIQARLYDYAAARFRVDQAFAPLLPQLSATLSGQFSSSTVLTTSSAGTTIGVQSSRSLEDTFLGQVSLSQLLFDFGKTVASVDAARKLAEVFRYDIELQRQLVTLAVKEAYTNTLFAQRLIKVQRQALERADLNLKSVRGFFEVGTRPKSDVVRAEVDVANARVDNIRADNAERVARVALNTSMGIPANTKFELVDNLVYVKVTDPDRDLVAEALSQRPEYAQAKLRIEGFESLLKRTFRDFFPDVVGTGSVGGVRSSLDTSWSAGIALNWSLFDGGNRMSRYREAKAVLEASQSRLKATELDIAREVEQARSTVLETDERILAAQAAVASAQENFRLVQGRFDAGVGTILDLTDAQLALTQAQNAEAQALADFRIALARLERALGRR
ncbi:MAG: TolC family protein [Candidatus Rokuibacteriota bacterium]